MVFQCPSLATTDPFGHSGFPTKITMGYVYNKLLSWNPTAKVVSPSSIFLVTEAYGNQGYLSTASPDYFDVGGGWGVGTPYSYGMGGGSTCTVYGGYNGLPAWQFDKIHGGTNNYLYVDGHVKALKAAGDPNTHPFTGLNPDGSLAGYWNCGDGCPCLWIPEFQ
jgi:prepilin-type processing-associated H-X9-DG protein